MTRHGTTTNWDLRRALLRLLTNGRAITTTELRTRVHQDGFTGITQETVYRHLAALAHGGHVGRITNPGRRHVCWVKPNSAAVQLKRGRL